MINISTDLNNIIQLDSLKQTIQDYQNKVSSSESKENEQVDSATNVELSDSVTNSINEVISEEDIQVKNLNTAQSIYNSLDDIRSRIAEMLSSLKEGDVDFILENVEKFEEESNILIQEAIDIVKNKDKTGLVDVSYRNIFTEGLNALKNLKINEDDYLTKLDKLLNNVGQKQKTYLNLSETLISGLASLSIKFDSMAIGINKVSPDRTSTITNIITTSNETLQSVVANISPEAVMRLLQE